MTPINKICSILFLLILFFACKKADNRGDEEKQTAQNVPEPLYDQTEGMQLLDTLGKVYGNPPDVAGFSLETSHYPDFIEGIYFDRAEVVFQVRGDTASARKELEQASGSKNFRLEPMQEGKYSQKQLIAIQEELNHKFESLENGSLKANVTGFGVGLRNIEIRLIVNTPEKQAEFRKKIMNSPAFRFEGPEAPVVDERIGVNDTLGIYLRPEYPFYPVEASQAKFVLYNHSGAEITCGEHYSITYEDEKGVWRELPINGNAVDIAYSVSPDGCRPFSASLYPEVHPNKPGRYRFFYEIRIDRQDRVRKAEYRKPSQDLNLLLMAEFRLSDKEQEWKKAEKTPVPAEVRQDISEEQLLELENEWGETIYDQVEEMPEFPGGIQAMFDFIKQTIRYPETARKNRVEGRVIVQVIIDKEGAVTEPTVLRSPDSSLTEEALRLVKSMPEWSPGKQAGKVLKVRYTFPITFKLTDEPSQ